MSTSPLYILFLCVGILHVCAFPAPQDTAPEDSSTDSEFEIRGTIDPLSVSDDTIPAEQESTNEESAAEAADSGNLPVETEQEESNTGDSEPQEESGSKDAPEQPNTNDEVPENEVTVNEDNPGASDANNQESANGESEDEEKSNEGEKSNGSNTEDHESGPEQDESESGDSGGSDTDVTQGVDNTVLSDVSAYGHHIRSVIEKHDNNKLVCQMLFGQNEEIFEKRCTALNHDPFFESQEYVIVDRRIINGNKYLCQEVISSLSGPVAELCITYDDYIFDPYPLYQHFKYI